MRDPKGDILFGHVTTLQKVTTDDAAAIIELRNDPLINRYLSSSATISLEQQIKWTQENDKKNDNYYWKIVSKDSKIVGTISLYNIKNKRAEFGRYICVNPMNAIESELMLLNFSFNVLKLDQVYCRTVAENAKVWKQHLRFGFTDAGVEENKAINTFLKVQEISRQQYLNFDYSSFTNIIKRFE